MEIVKGDKDLVSFDRVPVGCCFSRKETSDIYFRIEPIAKDAGLRLNAVNIITGYPVHIPSDIEVIRMSDVVLTHRSNLKN